MKTYLITGGAGFIGSHLADALLAAGHRAVALDDLSTGRLRNVGHLDGQPRFECIVDTLFNRARLGELVARADAIFHLAAAVGVRLIVESPVRTIETNVRGTDLASFVAAARKAVAEQVKLPPGYWIDWGGQYENLKRASQRLMILVPVSLLLILVLLYNTFSSMRLALLIFTNVMLGASGGIFALALRGLTFSITAGVGFITLFGVSVLNGVVLVSEINRLALTGMPLDEAIAEASREKLRPILMASMVALFGFIPMAISHAAGAEVQRPLATVVIGGLITSTPFTLYVLPILYRWITSDNAGAPEAAAAK